jgi:hypothetical protein
VGLLNSVPYAIPRVRCSAIIAGIRLIKVAQLQDPIETINITSIIKNLKPFQIQYYVLYNDGCIYYNKKRVAKGTS